MAAIESGHRDPLQQRKFGAAVWLSSRTVIGLCAFRPSSGPNTDLPGAARWASCVFNIIPITAVSAAKRFVARSSQGSWSQTDPGLSLHWSQRHQPNPTSKSELSSSLSRAAGGFHQGEF